MRNAFCVCFLLSFLTFGFPDALSFLLPPNQKMCFYQDVESTGKHSMRFYHSQKYQNQMVNVTLYSPQKRIMYTTNTDPYGEAVFEDLEHGTYTCCFTSQGPQSSNIVDFEISISNDDEDAYKQTTFDNPDVNEFTKVLGTLGTQTQLMKHHDRYLKTRAYRNIEKIRATSRLASGLAVFEAVAVSGSCVLSVFLLKRHFSSSKRTRA